MIHLSTNFSGHPKLTLLNPYLTVVNENDKRKKRKKKTNMDNKNKRKNNKRKKTNMARTSHALASRNTRKEGP